MKTIPKRAEREANVSLNDRLLLNSPAEIGERLRKARVKCDMSLADVAKATELSRGYISEIERGKPCSLYVLDYLCYIYSAVPESILLDNMEVQIVQVPTKGRRSRDSIKKAVEDFRNQLGSGVPQTI